MKIKLMLACIVCLFVSNVQASNLIWHFNLGSPIIALPAQPAPHYDDSIQMQWGCPVIDFNYGIGLQYNQVPQTLNRAPQFTPRPGPVQPPKQDAGVGINIQIPVVPIGPAPVPAPPIAAPPGYYWNPYYQLYFPDGYYPYGYVNPGIGFSFDLGTHSWHRGGRCAPRYGRPRYGPAPRGHSPRGRR